MRLTVGVTEGAPLFPLVVLFGLNAVDELDRTAFNVLTPEIRDHFNLKLTPVLAIISGVEALAILLGLPLAYFADRRRRTRMAAGGAALWGGFSVLTATAPTVPMLAAFRGGAGMGRAVTTPTHFSLLADYYPPDIRPKVYGFHRAANSRGAVRRPHPGRGRRLLPGMAGTVRALRHPHLRLRDARPAAAGTGAGRPRPGGGRGLGGRRPRDRAGAAVPGGLQDPLADPHPAADLVRPPLRRRRDRRPRGAVLHVLRGGVRAELGPAGARLGGDRARPDPRPPRRRPHRQPAAAPEPGPGAALPHLRGRVRGRRLRPAVRHAVPGRGRPAPHAHLGRRRPPPARRLLDPVRW